MKIIYLHQYFRKPTMSGGVRSYEFARRLVKDGHEVILITSDTDNQFDSWKIEDVDGIEVHWVSVNYNNKLNYFQRLYAFFKFLFLATIHILPIHCDKVIATSTPLTIAIPAMIYKFFKKKPFIFEVRDVWPEVPIALGYLNNSFLKKVAHALEKLTYSFSSSIIALSPDMKLSVQKRSKNKPIEVIPNASDVDLFKIKLNIIETDLYKLLLPIKEKHQKIVFYTGTLGLVNNIHYLLELASHSKGDVGFVIIGDGKEREELEALARNNGTLNQTIYFLDPVSKQELYIVHEVFDISCSTVLPVKELYANSANKVFDAFASGTPILINHEGWLKDLIDTENCGLVLGGKSDISQYNKLRDFLYNSEAIERARTSSRRLGQTTFNREYLYQKFLIVIKDAS